MCAADVGLRFTCGHREPKAWLVPCETTNCQSFAVQKWEDADHCCHFCYVSLSAALEIEDGSNLRKKKTRKKTKDKEEEDDEEEEKEGKGTGRLCGE
ncbi:hypothetical protein AJ80_07945 [Polytolypa hystricis UAMH7299]|uniref:Uncharacterized protein n=1 Tax=Polytolypa hystricis (strain UAMH7299) TaxID=1447883 RepID=A0A2B7XFM5_POLH7|nr:hypothetical protein AJ80_07945 [Polytolypa hystricis UAMH7299]